MTTRTCKVIPPLIMDSIILSYFYMMTDYQKHSVEEVETENVSTAVVINDTATDNEEVAAASKEVVVVVTQSSREYEDHNSCVVKNEAYGMLSMRQMASENRKDEDNLYELVV